jgi:spoIIIJ-associated protein
MRSIESEGETIDQAIESALRTLEVGRDRVEIEILTDATRGVFGFGGKRARVRATVRAPLASALDLGSTSNVSPETEGPKKVSRETRPTRPAGEARGPADIAALEARSREVLQGILAHLGVDCRIEAGPGDEGGLRLALSGDSSGLLIGRRGQTLDAIEYLVNRIVAREEETGGARVGVDVEGYRERRREYLDGLARRLADKAKETGRVITLNPMSPRDRRIVHLALQEDGAVETRSQGEGLFRKLLIVPVDRSRRGPRPERSG